MYPESRPTSGPSEAIEVQVNGSKDGPTEEAAEPELANDQLLEQEME